MAVLLFVMMLVMMSFCSLWLQFGSCAFVQEMLPTSFAPGQVLATLDPFTNSLHDNLSLTLFLRSENYLTLASLRRSQAHRYDINTTAEFCGIDVGTLGAWNWSSGCSEISAGNSCSATLSKDGDLQVLDGGSVAWSSHTSGKNVHSVELLDSGDLVLTDSSSNAIIWKSSENIAKGVCVSARTTSSPAHDPPSSTPAAALPPSPAASSPSSPILPPSPGAASTPSSPSPERNTMLPPSPPAASPPAQRPSGSSSAPYSRAAPDREAPVDVPAPAPASRSSGSRPASGSSSRSRKYSIMSKIIAILLSSICATLFVDVVRQCYRLKSNGNGNGNNPNGKPFK